jgi:predicted CxxxxCH...CXXCH cytochrome family protein
MAALACALAACAEPRPPAPAERCVSWQGEVAAQLAACTPCHSGAQPAGRYDLTSYLGALGGGADDVPDAIAGDASSRLLTRLEPSAADAPHQVSDEARAMLRRWVVDCEVAALETPVHARGVLDPASADFHGVTVAALGWDLGRCARCHGEAFDGGSAGASCNGCHAGGPTACATCHPLDEATAPRGAQGGARPYGAGALDGAHRRHAAAGLACAECHRVPEAWNSEGHVRSDGATGGSVDAPPAELSFGAAARRGGAQPSYDGARCSGVYCHGATLRDGGAAMPAPSWRDAPASTCGSCHGAPPATHADDRCAACHPTPATAARHLDGTVDVGISSGCSGCHGDASSPAPPRDLSGATATSALGVGAHRAHLEATHRLRGPIACATCHRVPAALLDAGHLDTAGPAEVEASLGWDRDAQTCASASCHGPARPRWTSRGEVSCGSCHGIPPADAAHAPGLPLTACAGCHPRSVDASGNILLINGPDGLTSEHLDGNVDLQ